MTRSVLVVEFRIHASHVEAFAHAIAANARASLESEPGCQVFDVCRDLDEPALFYLYEVYADEAAVAAHLQSHHFLAMNAETSDWVASKAVRRLQLPRVEEGAA
jgi:quinol monooxygenase YgiN